MDCYAAGRQPAQTRAKHTNPIKSTEFLPVKITPYTIDELKFAYRYQLYVRVKTWRRRQNAALANLTRDNLRRITDPLSVKVLKFNLDNTDLLLFLRFPESESVSTGISKIKGKLSKHLRSTMDHPTPKILGTGYFGCTIGENTKRDVERYLAKQSIHHGYDQRILPPVYLKEYAYDDACDAFICPKHAFTVLRYHVVLSTKRRQGVFGSVEGEAITRAWLEPGSLRKFVILKISFLPDHVHVAVRTHPAVSMPLLITELMNSGQDVMFREFPELLIKAGIDRLWTAGAYFGGYGNVNSTFVRRYIEEWNRNE